MLYCEEVLNRIIHDLSRVAETENIAILVTTSRNGNEGALLGEGAIGGNIPAQWLSL